MKRISLSILCLFLLQTGVWAQMSKPKREYVEFLSVTNHTNRNYALGDTASVTLRVYAGGLPLNNIPVYYTTGNEMMPADRTDSVLLRDGKAILPIGTSHAPGFRTCQFRFKVADKEYKDLIKVAYAPELIRPTIPYPDDFSTFWTRALQEADRTIPLNPVVTRLPQYDTDEAEVSLVKLDCGPKGRCIYGYLIKPKAEGTYPVILYPPGAGIKKMVPEYDYAKAGFISLKIEIHGLSPELSDEAYEELRKNGEDYMYKGLDSPENYYYKNVYIGCARAIDYLCSLPDFDGKNVGVSGGSQGGALAIVTAALNPKVTFLASFYPALSDMTGFLYGRAGGWPKFFRTEKDIAKLPADTQTVVRTLSYYDVVNFARQLRVPGFYSYGYNDETCSPTSVNAVINSVTAPKQVVITPTSGHWRFIETNSMAMEWMKVYSNQPK